MAVARSRLAQSQGQTLIVRIPEQGVRGARKGYVLIDVFSFESETPLRSGTELIIQYRIAGTRLWISNQAVVLGCVPGTSPVLVQGRLVSPGKKGAD